VVVVVVVSRETPVSMALKVIPEFLGILALASRETPGLTVLKETLELSVLPGTQVLMVLKGTPGMRGTPESLDLKETLVKEFKGTLVKKGTPESLDLRGIREKKATQALPAQRETPGKIRPFQEIRALPERKVTLV
jgi:hypothetical protein